MGENFDLSKTFDRSKNSIHRKFLLAENHFFFISNPRQLSWPHSTDRGTHDAPQVLWIKRWPKISIYRNFRLIFLFQSNAFFVVNCNRVKYFKYSKYYSCNSYATITVFNFQGYSLTHSSCNPLCFLHCQESVWVTDDVYQTVFLNECMIEFFDDF